MFGLGVGEVLVILVIALVFIGPKKLPELAKGLGKGMREFQNAMRGINQTFQNPPDPNTQDKNQQVNQSAPFEEQFPDDPAHDQNKPVEDIELEAQQSNGTKKLDPENIKKES